MPNLQLEGINMYGGPQSDFWDDYRRRASEQSQQQIDFDAQKSFLMNPGWHETLQRRSGEFDPRTYGKDLYGRTPQATGGMIGDTKFYAGADPRTGGKAPPPDSDPRIANRRWGG